MAAEAMYYDIPVPDDLDKIKAVHDGQRWLNGVIPGTAEVKDGILSFTIRWNRERRRITVAADLVGGYQCVA